MALFDRSLLNDGVRPREVFAWSMYDFANSGYTTVVLTAVFNSYFVGVVAGGASWATLAWTAAVSVSALLVMFTTPAIGAWADAHAAKKKLLMISTVGCVLGTVALAWAQPGGVWFAVFAVIVSNYFYSIGDALNGAFLPELARPQALGRVSGWGWSFGYFGGMLTLACSLAYVLPAQAAGQKAFQFVPVTMLITAAIFAIAAIPTALFLKERSKPTSSRSPALNTSSEISGGAIGGSSSESISGSSAGLRAGLKEALGRLRQTWRESRNYRDFSSLMLCAVFYQAGISVVIALAAIYAEEVMKFKTTDTMALIFVVNIASAIGAFAFGYWQDRLGHRRALTITLYAWILMVLIAGFSQTAFTFWIAATIAGLCMGSSQSCGRAMVGVLAPADRLGEFFGLWTFATRLSAVIGPITYGLVTWLSNNNHRLAILSTGLFFMAGLIVLARIDMQRGEQAALAAKPA